MYLAKVYVNFWLQLYMWYKCRVDVQRYVVIEGEMYSWSWKFTYTLEQLTLTILLALAEQVIQSVGDCNCAAGNNLIALF